MDVIVEGLSKAFGLTTALSPLSFSIAEGEFVSLLGPSGCGKTTLLRSLAGLETPDSGQIRFGSKVIFDRDRAINVSAPKRGVGMVFQDFALWPHMNVFETVAFGLRARGDTRNLKQRVQTALATVELEGFQRRLPTQLSGGQQQRVSFARAIVTEPQLILLDEPLSALDSRLREQLRRELVALTTKLGLTAVYVTHDQLEAMSMSDRIFVMHKGQILQAGQPEQIYNHPQHPFVAEFVGKLNRFQPSPNQPPVTFRPEQLQHHKQNANDWEFAVTVQSVAYLGDRYEVIVTYQNQDWITYFNDRPQIGETRYLFLPKEKINMMPQLQEIIE